MVRDLAKYCVSASVSLLDGLAALDRSDAGFSVVVDADDVVQGVLTDGDVRRAQLAGCQLDSPLMPHVHTEFFSVSESVTRAAVLDLMQARQIRHIPVIGDSGELLGIHLLSSMIGNCVLPNWAVIMAGGKGTRLGKRTAAIPKPMLKIAGKPILERLVLHLVSHGIRRIFISVNYLSHIIEDYFQDGAAWGCQISYLKEKEPLGSGGALSLLPELPRQPLILMNGDLVLEANLSELLRFHETGNYYATMGAHYYTHEVPFGCLKINNNQLTELEEKPLITKTINGGVYVVSSEAIQTVPKATYFPITKIFEDALKSSQICGVYPMGGDWLDVGEPNQLNQARGMT